MKKPTLKDIADLTNLSTSTISRILNGDKSLNVLEETRENVLNVANKLGYIKNNLTNYINKPTLALIHWYDSEQELLDNYYLYIRDGIEKFCANNDIKLVKTLIKNNTYFPNADGALALGKFDNYETSLISKKYKNVVFVDSSPDDNKFDSVVIDFNKAYTEAINYLKKLGHEKIGFIGGREYTKTLNKVLIDERELVFKNKIENHQYIHIGTFSMESGYNLMNKALNKKDYATAYLIASDSMAIGALKAIHDNGLKVPDDISIIGFNDIEQSSYTIPPLTTIKVFKNHMGEKAIKLLLEQINGRKIYEKTYIQTKLIKRESVRKVK